MNARVVGLNLVYKHCIVKGRGVPTRLGSERSDPDSWVVRVPGESLHEPEEVLANFKRSPVHFIKDWLTVNVPAGSRHL